jgi:hypothetical protein
MPWLLKRWWFWAGCLFMLVAIVAGYLLIPVSASRITQETCDKIQLGWTEREVVKLLGPNHDWTVGEELTLLWYDEDGNQISVAFPDDGRVTRARFSPTQLTFLNCCTAGPSVGLRKPGRNSAIEPKCDHCSHAGTSGLRSCSWVEMLRHFAKG